MATKKLKYKPTVKLTAPQLEFINAKTKFTAFIGGLGSGKTFIGLMKVFTMPPNSVGLVCAPTYKVLKDGTLASFFKVMNLLGLPDDFVVSYNRSDNEIVLQNGTRILFRSLENYEILRSLEVDWLYIDEAALCSYDAYQVAIGRLRGKVGPHYAWLSSTPRGKKNWLYVQFVERANKSKTLVYAKSTSNKFLPDGYLDSLVEDYSSLQQRQELDGEFVEEGQTRILDKWLNYQTIVPQGLISMGVDLASSLSANADYTAMVVTANNASQSHVLHAERHRLPFHQSCETIIACAKQWNVKVIFVETVQYQTAAVQELSKLARPLGITIKGCNPKGNKLMRFLPLESRIERGMISFSNNLCRDFVDELCAFTGTKEDKHDDFVDALVYSVGEGTNPVSVSNNQQIFSNFN